MKILFALYEGGSGKPATAQDAKGYAEQLGITKFPVLADPDLGYATATPMTQMVHPEQCIVGPDMTILQCSSGHDKVPMLLEAIKGYAGK